MTRSARFLLSPQFMVSGSALLCNGKCRWTRSHLLIVHAGQFIYLTYIIMHCSGLVVISAPGGLNIIVALDYDMLQTTVDESE